MKTAILTALTLSGLALAGCAATTPQPTTLTGYMLVFVRPGEPNLLYAASAPEARDESTCFNVAWNELPIPAAGEIAVRGEVARSQLPACGGRLIIVEDYLTDLQR